MTFETLKAARDQAEAELSRLGEQLNAYPRNSVGLTPDHIKLTPEWRALKGEADAAHVRLRRINQHLVKHYGKELKAERDAKRAARLAAA